MTVIPAAYDLRIPQRADFAVRITLPFDCTNKTVAADVWNQRRSKLFLSFAIEWEDQAGGILWLKATWAQTRVLTDEEGRWDLLVLDTVSQTRDYYLEGSVTVDLNYTEIEP